MTTQKPIGDRSYGIIALSLLPNLLASTPPTSQNTTVFLIKQKTSQRLRRPPFWTFPKGHAEPCDATTKHTAIRELKEETNLDVELGEILPLNGEPGGEGFVEVYVNPVRIVGKVVRYWVAVVKRGQEVRIQEKEVEEGRWCGWDEAIGLITFEEGKEVLRGVREALDREAAVKGG